MKPFNDLLGGALALGQQVAYAVISHGHACLRVGTIARVDAKGEILVQPDVLGARSVWKAPKNLVRIAIA